MTVPQSAPLLCRPLPSPPAPTSPPALILLDVQGRVIHLQEEHARPGHCITICLHWGGGNIFAWHDLPLLSSCWNVTQAVASPLRQHASVCVRFARILASHHPSRGTSAAGCLSFGMPETLHFINRCQCCYDGAWRSDPHVVRSGLRWK